MVDDEIRGELIMSFKDFDMTDIENAKAKYEQEVEDKWGSTDAYKQSKGKTSKYTKDDWKKISSEENDIFSGFSKVSDIKSQDAKDLVDAWKDHTTRYYYDCTDEILLGLADMYIADERFSKNIDKFGKGTAEKMSGSIKLHCKQ